MSDISQTDQQVPDFSQLSHFKSLAATLDEGLAGHTHLTTRLVLALLCQGHLLIEGAPGLAKTRAVKLFSGLMHARFSRIQATPDLLPADLTGSTVYHPENASFSFHPGPLFNHIILVDEINRAPPKVQSALLEAMAETQITVAGETHRLEQPFIVIATQNPIEHEGTYPLPEAQRDRFLFFLELPLPQAQLERQILDLVLAEESRSADPGEAQIHADDILAARTDIARVHLSEAVRDYIVRLVCATRGEGSSALNPDWVSHPISPRGSIFLAQAARAHAWFCQRDHVTPEDIRELAADVLSGRLIISYQALAEGISARQLVQQLLDTTETG